MAGIDGIAAAAASSRTSTAIVVAAAIRSTRRLAPCTPAPTCSPTSNAGHHT